MFCSIFLNQIHLKRVVFAKKIDIFNYNSNIFTIFVVQSEIIDFLCIR